MKSGGSLESWSLTWLAETVTVHCALLAKLTVGFKVKLVGPPETVAVWVVLPQVILNQLLMTVTGSLKLMVMLASTRTLEAFLPGELLETKGAISLPPPPPPPPPPEEERGLGVPTVKSETLLSVSVMPSLFLSAAVVFESPPVAPHPS
jgi:hypothetical protein